MAQATISPLGEGPSLPSNPDIETLLRLVLNAQDLVVAEGVNEGKNYVFVSALESEVMFRFDQTPDGYTVKRTK